MAKGYRNPGDVELKTFTLISTRGEVIDCSKLYREWNVYQDLSSHYLTLDVVMFDAGGILNSIEGGFTGGEVLVIAYKTGGPKDKVEYKTHAFAITDLTNRQTVDEKNEIYMLSGISIESFNTIDQKISRAYGPNLISKMVDSMCKEFFFKPTQTLYKSINDVLKININKKYNIEESKSLQKYVVPNVRVDDIIDQLCKEAISNKDVSHYIFYEDTSGYNFVDLNSIVLKEPRYTLSYAPSNFDEGDNNAQAEFTDPLKIISYTIIKEGNVFDNMMSGLYKSKTIALDILRKNKTETIYDYTKFSPKFNKLQPFLVPGDSKSTAIVDLMTSRNGHDSDPFFNNELPLPKKTVTNTSKRRSYFKHLTNRVLSVTIPGNSEVLVGDVIYLSIPSATNLDGFKNKEDKYLSGKYIVSKARHKHIEENFTTFLECIKDTGIKE